MKCRICEGKHCALGLCEKHYKRMRLYGDPLASKRPHASLQERFWAKFLRGEEGECWNWTGAITRSGYGVIQEAGKGSRSLSAHRVSFRLANGEIAPGMQILHSCDNRRCVNPAHLRQGSGSENIKEAYTKGRKISPFANPANRYRG